MIRLKSFKTKILIPSVGVMTLVLILVVVYTSVSVRDLVDDLAEERASMISQATHLRLEELADITALSARLVSQSDVIADVVRTYTATQTVDRVTLLTYLEGRRREIGAGNLLVLDNLGYCIIRTNLPDIYGDNMAIGSANVRAAIQGETVTAFGIGALVIRMSLSTYTPIISGGEQIGVFIARVIMNEDAFVDRFADVFDAHVTIYTGTEIVATTIRDAAGSRILGEEAPEQMADIVLNQNQIFRELMPVNGVPHHVYVFPVHNVAGVPIGMFFVAFSNERTLAAIMGQQRYMIFIGLAGLVLAGFVMFLYAMKLLKPLNLLTSNLYDIANGSADLTKKLPIIGEDEIARASTYFNQTIEGFRALIVSIKKQADELSDIGNNLANNMTETSSAMNQIAANIHNTKGRILNQSASVTQTNGTMEQVTVNINKLSGNVERQANAVIQASSALEQMMTNIHSVSSTLVKNAANVKDLRESSETGKNSLQEVVSDIQEIARESEGLLEINSVMESIAGQTNLLSMNAAIEAAHAGDAGRGFAVVADEIRKLAESSSEQSKVIGNVLKKIKESMDKITRSTDNVLNKFEAIDHGVRTVAEQEEVIRNAMEEQSHGSKQVLSASGQVGEITQQVKGGSQEMLEGSKEVITESKNLERVTQEITNGINEMATGAEQVNKAVTTVNDLAGRTQENISSLVRAVSQFKV